MRRLSAVRAAGVAVLMVSTLTATASTATAAGSPKTQQQPSSTWTQPGTAPLDGLGALLYVAAPTAGPAQGSALGYEYTLSYHFQDGSLGLLALGYQHGQKVAGFARIDGSPVTTVPFDWSFGHAYFLFTYKLAASQWGGWVFDFSSLSWTSIAVVNVPAGTGGITPTSTTTVDYDPTLAPTAADQSTCVFYPQVDAYVFPPVGWRGATPSLATLSGNTVQPGDCPSTTTAYFGWQHYHLGSPAAAAG
jgi:hypothetical protein